MHYLFSIAALLTMLSQHNQNLPKEFYGLPESIRDSATVIVSGTFGQGRTPCMFLPDGTRRWGLDSWITIKRVYRGKVSSRTIRINIRRLPATEYVPQRLDLKHEYLVLLRPGTEKMKQIQSKEGNSFWESVRDEEIIAIVESK